MCGAWVCIVISSEMWDGNGRCFELNGCVSCCRMGTVPGAMMVEMLDGWKG